MFTGNEPQPSFTRIETNQPLTGGVDLSYRFSILMRPFNIWACARRTERALIGSLGRGRFMLKQAMSEPTIYAQPDRGRLNGYIPRRCSPHLCHTPLIYKSKKSPSVTDDPSQARQMMAVSEHPRTMKTQREFNPDTAEG